MKNKAFTLMEMLIVIVLIGIIGGISIKYFSSGNFSKQQSAGVECGMYLTHKINDFVDAARKSSNLTIKNENNRLKKIIPNKYNINFIKETDQNKNDKISFNYLQGNESKQYKENILDTYECKTGKYKQKLYFTGTAPIKLNMNRGFQGNKIGEITTFAIESNNGDPKTEYDIILQSCRDNYCIDAYKFNINIATQKVNPSICRSYVMGEDELKNKCKKRR